jgi:toxin secretion/phage lysis holin
LENIIKLLIAGTGSLVTYLFGGWSTLLELLVIFVVLDYLSGFWAAGTEGKLSSKVGLRGIPKKVFIFAMVFIGYKIDLALGDQTLIRDTIIFFYLANELTSIIENSGRIGLPIPPVIKKAVEVLRSKGDQ